MRARCIAIAWSLVCLLPAGRALGQPERANGRVSVSSIVGEWIMETDLNGQPIPATMTLEFKDGSLRGVWKSGGAEMELEDLKLERDQLSFKRTIPGGQVLVFKGRIGPGRVRGTFTGPFGELECTGRQKFEPKGPARRGGRQPAAGRDGAASARGGFLDGKNKSFVVVGYSTSYAWPAMLQDMLDKHAGDKRVYHVLNAVVGGSPVEYWIADKGADRYEQVYGAMLRDYFGGDARLRGDAPKPTIALCQQSLQFTRTQKGPIKTITDAEGLKTGADALEKLAKQLHSDGIAKVVIGMHIYKKGYEPEVGNERFALKALLARGHDFVVEGPDVWSLTVGEHPAAFTEDGLHPNQRGMKIMAEAWYRAIAGPAAKQTAIDALHKRDYDTDAMMREYLAWRRGAGERQARADRPADEDEPAGKPKMSTQERFDAFRNATRDLIELADSKEHDKALAKAKEALDHARALGKGEGVGGLAKPILAQALYNVACMYSLMKQTDDAFEYLGKAIDVGAFPGGTSIADQMEDDSDLDNMRDDRRYRRALRRARRQGDDDPDDGDDDRQVRTGERRFRGRLGADSDKFKTVGDKTQLWAAGDRENGDAKWYDFTGAPMPAKDLQFGIGQDSIKSIDDPLFVEPDDPRLLKLPVSRYRRRERPKTNDEIMVIGYAAGDDVRAYPTALLDRHELVNDRLGGKPVTVGW